MRILLDENIGTSVARALAATGHDVVMAASVASGDEDAKIWSIARREHREPRAIGAIKIAEKDAISGRLDRAMAGRAEMPEAETGLVRRDGLFERGDRDAKARLVRREGRDMEGREFLEVHEVSSGPAQGL